MVQVNLPKHPGLQVNKLFFPAGSLPSQLPFPKPEPDDVDTAAKAETGDVDGAAYR